MNDNQLPKTIIYYDDLYESLVHETWYRGSDGNLQHEERVCIVNAEPLEDDECVTVGELREWLRQFPSEGQVWIGNDKFSGQCRSAYRLNRIDVILENGSHSSATSMDKASHE